jgi:hypothetical protein
MATPDLTHLGKLLGDAWIDAEVFGKNPSHLLGRWQKNNPSALWVTYTEGLVKAILTSDKVKLDSKVLADKLKSVKGFVPTLAEMESATFLAAQGFTVTLEPTAPEKGPDLRADWEGVPYFVEVRTVGFSEDEERRDSVSEEIFSKLNTVPSSYLVGLTVTEEYAHGSPKLKDAVEAVVTSLGILKDRGANEGKLYYAGAGEVVLVCPGMGLTQKHYRIMDAADFTARFESLGKESSGTQAYLLEQRNDPTEPVNDHERLKGILRNKRKQLPKGSRGIVLLDVSKLFMLSDFSIDRALYGDLLVEFARVNGPEEEVGEPTTRRNTRGFLLHTSRVSAVVIQKRKVEAGEVKIERHVYPTNRANSDTTRLNLAELKRLGDIGDRDHLCAENAPDDHGQSEDQPAGAS